ncbi:HAUS augmin-like complex subunit 3 [Hyalella azteca]|uniref:HAUS augmin-like complex subunit 3 n=1 Tax=Hyalella azteca TaxID=294128 RepID=A0A8B7NI53_HYAAZ|nr:HAUS augmin-like complex subunit 3 [Hyalella azteca]
MLGSKLVDKLEELGLCEPKSLVGSDLDWLFIGSENEALKGFCNWFCDNINSSDVLSEEELLQYQELQRTGQVLEGSQLDAMAVCLSGFSSLVPTSQEPLLNVELTEPEIQTDHIIRIESHLKKLDHNLKRLEARRAQLSLQDLSAGSELEELQTALASEERCLARQQAAALSAAGELTQNLTKLSATVVELTEVLSKFVMKSGDDEKLLVCSDLSSWEREERNCSRALEQLSSKLFSVEETAGFNLGESEQQQDLTVTWPPALQASSMHQDHEAELKRLHELILKCSINCATAEVEVARKKAELQEVGRALELVTRGQYSSCGELSLNEEARTALGTLRSVREEVEQQKLTVETLVKTCAERHKTATLTTDTAARHVRQLYCSDQLRQLTSLFVEQQARHDYLSIMIQCEVMSVEETLQLLREATSLLTLQHHRALQRATQMKELTLRAEVDRTLGGLPAPLATLGDLLSVSEDSSTSNEEVNNDGTEDDLFATMSQTLMGLPVTLSDDHRIKHNSKVAVACEALDQLLDTLEKGKQALGSYRHAHAIKKLWSKCGLLEECLGGSGGRLPGCLPNTWLPARLLDAQSSLEDQAAQLKHEILAFLSQDEQKKKILIAQPELAEKLSSWNEEPKSQ